MDLQNIENIMKLKDDGLKMFSQKILEEQSRVHKMAEDFIACLVVKSLKHYDITQIKSLGFDLNYPSADEGFSGNFMVLINGEDPTLSKIDEEIGFVIHKPTGDEIDFEELQQYLHDVVLPYRHILKDNVYLSSGDIKTYMKSLEVSDLDENLMFSDSKRKNNKI